MLTVERLRNLLNFDPETGVFSYAQWRHGLRRDDIGKPAGRLSSEGYVLLQIDGRTYLGHRLAWLHFHGSNPVHEIDHINGVKHDNRIANLRDVTRKVNAQNLHNSLPKRSRDAPLGVSWNRRSNAWRAMIWDGAKNIYLGMHATPEAAHQAYLEAKRQMHQGCTI